MRAHQHIRSTNESSDKFGPCELCGKHCTEVFMGRAEIREGTARFLNFAPGRFGHAGCVHRAVSEDMPAALLKAQRAFCVSVEAQVEAPV